MSNYPPGVSGNEFQITGPLDEWTMTIDCPCGAEGVTADAWWHPDTGAWVTCPVCRTEQEIYDDPGEDPDPDAAYDAWRERAWDL